ncbi:putative Cysteine string protein [Daphnia magna]|uniref:Putative Cysteine string protein n=1 Tax=Daphnia magna TaxID=35525 RepID=A0A164IRN3_9CRUS|nr:putative Cysteine string protein [Daphnia magna]
MTTAVMKRKQRKSERRKEMRYLFNLNQGMSVKQQALIHRTSPLFTPQQYSRVEHRNTVQQERLPYLFKAMNHESPLVIIKAKVVNFFEYF